MALQRRKAAYGAMQRTQEKQARLRAEAANQPKLALIEMDPKSMMAATKRTKGDNARFGKFMALQRRKAAYGAMQRTQEKQAEEKKQAAMAAFLREKANAEKKEA